MRQLLIFVPRRDGPRVAEAAADREGMNVWRLAAHSRTEDGDEAELVVAHLPNRQVGPFLRWLGEALPEATFTLLPRGVLPMAPPVEEAPEQVKDVGMRSPIEVLLAGLQSVGSWTGFVGYAVSAGIVVWIGLYTDTIFLLTASMLIAPFAGPAMNTAIATATGEVVLLRQSLVRYAVGLLLTAATAFALSLVWQQEIATALMVDVSEISTVAVLLPLVAGVAGALNLVQSERDSLVSGAAIGVLVAASLAPPTGLVGMGAAMGEWEMAKSGLFVLLLQLVGINLSGTLVFRLFGLSTHGTRFVGGTRWAFPLSLALTAVALAALLWWQFSSAPELQRSTRAQRAALVMERAVEEADLAGLVEVSARFTRADLPGQNTLLGEVYVQRPAGSPLPPDSIADRLTRRVQERLLADGFDVTPLVSVTVLEPPGRRRRAGPR